MPVRLRPSLNSSPTSPPSLPPNTGPKCTLTISNSSPSLPSSIPQSSSTLTSSNNSTSASSPSIRLISYIITAAHQAYFIVGGSSSTLTMREPIWNMSFQTTLGITLCILGRILTQRPIFSGFASKLRIKIYDRLFLVSKIFRKRTCFTEAD